MQTPDIAIGVDVGGVRKGFHVVALDSEYRLVEVKPCPTVKNVMELITELQPAIIAVDAPCGWSATGKSRKAERSLAQRGVSSFSTPMKSMACSHKRGFYNWVLEGEALYATAAVQWPTYKGRGGLRGRMIEVFPNATAVAMAQAPRPRNISKVRWRRQLLTKMKIDSDGLPNIDFVDAALCAWTGLRALLGDFEPFPSNLENSEEGLIIVPTGIPARLSF